jgi:hypothetical protein
MAKKPAASAAMTEPKPTGGKPPATKATKAKMKAGNGGKKG